MTAILSLATVTLPLLYLVVFGAYVWLFREDHPVPRRICSRLAAITVLLHVAALVVRGLFLQRLPLGNPLEFASALAAALMATYLIIEVRWRTKQTGFVVAGLAFVPAIPGQFLRDPGNGCRPAAARSGLCRSRGVRAAGLHGPDPELHLRLAVSGAGATADASPVLDCRSGDCRP